jgi:CRP/FNR family cyclic AMP-dependent transcriptional regulator
MKKILLIEDDSALRENIAEILQLANYEVITAKDGKSGIEKSIQEKPDLIICDVLMPGLDGYGVIHVLSRHPETFTIPFIFLTGKNEPADLRKGMDLGADDYLFKPIDENDLLNTIEVRLWKAEGIKTNVVQNKTGISKFIRQVKGMDSLNLVSGERDIHRYKKKHILFSTGLRPSMVYFVISGKVKEYLINDTGKELITNMYTKGDFIGYTAILEDISYTETAQIIEDAELMLIPKSDFLQLIYNDRQVARQFISLLTHKVREKEERLLNLAYNSLRKKVATGIIEVMDKFKEHKEGKLVVDISRDDLANVVGSAQESMIRTLKEFKTENLIEIKEGNIIVLNEKRLRHLQY